MTNKQLDRRPKRRTEPLNQQQFSAQGANDQSPIFQGPEYQYHLLRAASELFQSSIATLKPEQYAEAERQAKQTFSLEDLVLSSDEAGDVLIPDNQVQDAYQEVVGRYSDEHEFEADLAKNRMDSTGLRLALRRELIFDAVMQRVGAARDAITETDERLFYELHHARFAAPERRTARHILVTINDDYDENTRAAARARLEAIADKLRVDTSAANADAVQRFARQARRHSECPSAMDQGKIGTLIRGQLYPQVDAALFALDEGGISGIVESPLGLHLVLCERIQPPRTLPFHQVRERIHQALEQRHRRETQRAWLAELRQRRSAVA
jgi:peptidyl-prolyl cis-trans isomerase C